MSLGDVINDLVIFACAVSLIVVSYFLAKIPSSTDKVSRTILQLQSVKQEETCEQCNHHTEKSYLFCIYCGIKRFKKCAFCKAYMKVDARYCPKCRAKMWLNGEEKEIIEGI